MLAWRKAINSAQYKILCYMIQSLFLRLTIYKESQSVMLYIPINNEPDTDEIISAAFRDNKIVLLPCIRDDSIVPVIYKKDMPLKYGRYHIKEPIEQEFYPAAGINVVVVPGVAFDRLGSRIGYGKGYYDRFLCSLDNKTIKVGFSFNGCIVDHIHKNERDIPVDMVLTETGVKTKERDV